jgi:Leucine-rich repeat (LRR) protein
MKKTLKIVLPILLIFALLILGYWFFFQYRVDLTTGLLRSFARSQLESGHYTTAIRCYRWANDLDPQDAELAMELAEAYRGSGNYTRTESVLVHAIYDAPDDVRLYEALSRVYVEQDKLLDAQQMLDTVSNSEALAALSAKRPAAPTVTPEAGFYSEYITVTVQCPDADAACYCSVDGDYPSLESDGYSGTISLPGGKTTVRAVAVGSDGLVSPLASAEYTVAGVIEDVTFHDEALKTATQELLLRGDRTLRTDDLWGIEEMTLPAELADTTDLRLYTGMTKLIGRDLGELDYSFLEAMTKLSYLELENCTLTTESLKAIGACSSLEVLILANCGLTNVAPLETLTNLRVLDLSENAISTISPLTAIAGLDELYLEHNALTRLPNLNGFQALRVLDLSYNALDYVGGVSSCTTIQRLNLSHNRLSSVMPLSALKELIWLDASNNSVTDVSALAPCTKLEGFLMTDNKLKNIDFLSNCPSIREVNIDYNDVEAAPDFQPECPLETFSAAHNFLEDLSGLGGLQQLTLVNADYNNIRDISVLRTCPALIQVNVYNTYIRDGGELAENGVIVNFTPEF